MFKKRIIINEKKIKAIFFDFDGVILDTVDIKTRAFKKLFDNYPPKIVNKILQHHIDNGGMSRFEKIKYYYKNIIKEKLDENKLKSLCDQFSILVFEKVIKAKFIDGVLWFIKKNYNKFQYCIISGTPQDELIRIVEIKKIKNYFTDVLGSPISKNENIKFLLKKYKLNSHEVVYIGDSVNDYKAAISNKLLFISVTH